MQAGIGAAFKQMGGPVGAMAITMAMFNNSIQHAGGDAPLCVPGALESLDAPQAKPPRQESAAIIGRERGRRAVMGTSLL